MKKKMAELKTQQNSTSVSKFLQSISDEKKRIDCQKISEIMGEITGEKPVMWGDNIVGFGLYHYKYSSGREGDWFLTGFSPRKQNISLYLVYGVDKFEDELSKLGKHKTAKACLYIKSLADVDTTVLKELIRKSVKTIKQINSEE